MPTPSQSLMPALPRRIKGFFAVVRKFAERGFFLKSDNTPRIVESQKQVLPTAQWSSAGFSLIEIMVSVAVLAMFMSGALVSQLQSNRMASRARNINAANVILREASDRFQRASQSDSILSATDGDELYESDVVIYDEDPSSNSGAGSTTKLEGDLYRNVVYLYGNEATESSFSTVTFRLRYLQDPTGANTSISTNRAVP